MPENNKPFEKYTKEELRNAETVARGFLTDNAGAIADTMRAKAKYLESMIDRVGHKKTSFDERLECFARISEIARLIIDDADGFFQLASAPVVAQILKTVRLNSNDRPKA